LAAKIRPISPRGTGLPSSPRIANEVLRGGRPAVPGWTRRSRGVAMLTQEASVEP